MLLLLLLNRREPHSSSGTGGGVGRAEVRWAAQVSPTCLLGEAVLATQRLPSLRWSWHHVRPVAGALHASCMLLDRTGNSILWWAHQVLIREALISVTGVKVLVSLLMLWAVLQHRRLSSHVYAVRLPGETINYPLLLLLFP